MALLALVVIALAVGLVVTNVRISGRPALSRSQVDALAGQQAKAAVGRQAAQPPASVGAYRAVVPSLVILQSPLADAPGSEALGTGVVIDQQGDILTALHVVAGSSLTDVTFADGTVTQAGLKSADPANDIAVLRPASLPAVLKPAVLGGGPQIGDPVFAVGNPVGLAASLSAGVVSGLDRSYVLPDGTTQAGLIQFDAAVNPGSSGGPLVDARGEVIGIVVGLDNPAGQDSFSGIGFAVPIQTAGGAAGAPAK